MFNGHIQLHFVLLCIKVFYLTQLVSFEFMKFHSILSDNIQFKLVCLSFIMFRRAFFGLFLNL